MAKDAKKETTAEKRIAKLDAALAKALKRIEALEQDRLDRLRGYPGYD
jgi:hypothetical protein